jgi:hypothetical protein
MGEAWFMGTERKMFPQLLGNIDALPDDYIAQALEEISSGSSSFGPFEEWAEWYHYLLPRLIQREWKPTYYHPAELLVTGFMAQYPAPGGSLPYPHFHADAINTLGRYVMSSRCWPKGQLDVVNCLGKWTGPSGIAGWSQAGGLLSASLFFCIKYLPRSGVEEWFRSVIAISNSYWQVQIITWLVGAHPILTGDIQQPSEFPEGAQFGVGWAWSHALNGNYSGTYDGQNRPIPFLPTENRAAVLRVAHGMDVQRFIEDFWTDPSMTAVASETAGLADSFLQLYKADRVTN